MDDRKRKTGVHEAGHAVIARALGIAAGEVTIRPTEDHSLGHSVFADPRFDWRRGDGKKSEAANAFAISLFAGAEAERFILGSEEVGDAEDRSRAIACLAWAGAVRGASFVGDDRFDIHEAKGALRNNLATFSSALLVRSYGVIPFPMKVMRKHVDGGE